MNRSAVLARFGGNEQLFAEMARFFLEDSPQLLDQIREGLATKNAEQVTRCAHSLKGLAANFDAHETAGIARQIEDLGRRQDLAQVAGQLPQLLQQVERLQADLRPYADQSRP